MTDASAKAAFFWAGCSAISLVWFFFRVPETKNLTFAEVDLLFEEGISARKFKQASEEMRKAQSTIARG